VIFSSLIAALLGDAKPARAQTISGSVPEVDRATIRVVTDNYHFALSPSGKIGDVEVGRIVFPLSEQPPGKVLLSEFGLSMHLETQRGNETRNVLTISAIPHRRCLTTLTSSASIRPSSTPWC
jgi:7,8-dihydropterin-6-yl-methyl-4-(beta-D-ribofuranosyl)aminobenzene 5'-phosphate synthase